MVLLESALTGNFREKREGKKQQSVILFDRFSKKLNKKKRSTVREDMHVCVCVCSRLGRELSVLLVQLQQQSIDGRVLCLTGYSDYLTGVREPLSLPYRCHTSFKRSNAITFF